MRAGRRTGMPSALVLLPILATSGLALAVSRVPILTPDVWWHLATGRWILEHGIPTQDPFSYMLAGRAWTPHEWLSELLMASLLVQGDLGGIVWLRTVLVVLGWWVSYRLARLHAARGTSLVLLMLAAYVSQRHWLDRPQLWSNVFLPLVILLLERHRLRPGRWVWMLPVVFAAWVNLHGGFMLGLVLLVAWSLAPLRRAGERRSGLARRMTIAGLSVAAACLNPQGVRGMLYPLHYVGSGLRATIQEEQAGVLAGPYAWVHWGLVLAGFVLLILQRRRAVFEHAMVYTILAWLSWPRLGGFALPFAAERHAALLLHAGIPLVAGWLEAATRGRMQDIETRLAPRLRNLPVWITAGVVSGFVLWQVGRARPRHEHPNDWILPGRFPVAASDWIASRSFPVRLLNPYRWGGYLAFRLHPRQQVWIDSRGDLHGAARLQEDEILHRFAPIHAAEAERLLARDDPDAIVYPLLSFDTGTLRVHPFTRWIASQPDWRLVFFDGPDRSRPRAPWATTAVFVRVHPRNAAWLERLPAVALPPGLPP